MNALLIVLRKTIVNQFYRQNAWLFFVVLMLAGSFLRASDHIAMAEAAVHSPFMLALYQAFWAIYVVFAIHFAISIIQRTEVLYFFRLIPTPRRWLGILFVELLLLTPILVYTAFVGWIGLQHGISSSSWQLVAGAIFMVLIPLFWLDYTLRTPNRQSLTAKWKASWALQFTTPYPLFFVRYLLKEQPVLFFITKGGTCLLLLGVLVLYPTDDYDSRLLALGTLLVGVSHSTITYQLYQFEHERLAFIRNLPLTRGWRLLNYAFMFAILLLPEAIILIRYQPSTIFFSVLLSIWFLAHSIILLLFTLLLPRHRLLDQLMPMICVLMLVLFLAIMYKVPIWVLVLFNLLGATNLFIRFYMKSVWVTEAAA